MKSNRKFLFALILVLFVGSIVIPIAVKKLTYVEAARIELQITWSEFQCKKSRDRDSTGEFYLQFKYFDGRRWRIEKTKIAKLSPAYPASSHPKITYTLREDIQVGTNLYIRLLEKDWFARDDLVIPKWIDNHGSGDSIHWNSFYVSWSFSEKRCEYSNPDLEVIKVTFTNMG